jgi:hypothetical protein
LQLCLWRVRDGERVVYLGFRETLHQLLAKSRCLCLAGRTGAAAGRAGHIDAICWEPVELFPDQVLDHPLGVLDQTGARCLIIDSVAEPNAVQVIREARAAWRMCWRRRFCWCGNATSPCWASSKPTKP